MLNNELLIGMGILLGSLIVGCLVAGGLYLASIAIYNKLCKEENQVDLSSFGYSLLAGFLSVGGFASSYIAASILSSFLMFSTMSGPGPRSGPAFNETLMIVIGVGLILAILGITYAVKTLIARMLVPCDFGTAAIISALWIAMETLFWVVSITGIILLFANSDFQSMWP